MVSVAITDLPIITITGILSIMIIMGSILLIITGLIITVDIMGIILTLMDMDTTAMPAPGMRIMDAAWLRQPIEGVKWAQGQK